MGGQLLQSTFHVVIDDNGLSFRLLSHDLEAVETLWASTLGSKFFVQTAIDPLLGSGIQLVKVDNTSILFPGSDNT